jgi:DNA polymerase epsilon subunit 1
VPDVRDIVDWAYYKERLGNAIQKIITIPAAMQRVPNPVPRVRHPDWLHKRVAEKDDTHKQAKVDALFAAARGRAAADPEAAAALRAKRAAAAANAAAVGDLEDFGGPAAGRRSPATGCAAAVGIASSLEVTPGTAAAAQAPEAPGEAALEAADGPAPSRQEAFTGWLAAKKAGWRRSRAERKRQREASGGGEGRRQRPRAAAAAGVDGMFQQQAAAAAGSAWQLVAVAPTREPGVYKAWAVINGRMHAIPLRIPRTFYVDASLAPGHPGVEGLGPLVRRTLPGGAEPHYTYQVSMAEADYRAALPRLEGALGAPGIRGVYEARVPPELNAALSAGCVAVVAPGAARRNLGAGFDLSELQMRPVVQYDYFSGGGGGGVGGGGLRHMALHHSEDAAAGRALYALHLPADGACHVWVVNPARGGQKEVNAAAAARAGEDAAAAAAAAAAEEGEGEGEGDAAPPACPRFEVAYVRSAAAAAKALQRLLARIK